MSDRPGKKHKSDGLDPIDVESPSLTASPLTSTASGMHGWALLCDQIDSKFSPMQQIFLIDLWSDDCEIVKNAINQLNLMCSGNSNKDKDHNRAAIVRIGGSATLVATMLKWHTHAKIQAEACQALQNVAFKNVDFKTNAKDTGVLHAIVWAMEHHPHDSDVQASACGALANFVATAANTDCIVHELNGIEHIIGAMTRFKENAKLQQFACLALDNLLKGNLEFKQAIVDAGGRRVLFDAIENHNSPSKEHSKYLQERASSALAKLLKKVDENQK